MVEGDVKVLYTRFRDYLQEILETNPGSRRIVTNKVVKEHSSVEVISDRSRVGRPELVIIAR